MQKNNWWDLNQDNHYLNLSDKNCNFLLFQVFIKKQHRIGSL